jgi:probable phosphomutase (TIGR03848 family)
MTRIYLIRHAVTDYTGKILSGRTPGITLNDTGRQQAEWLADRLSVLPIKAIYSSPLERAVETALPLSGSLNLSCVISEDFLEIDFGKWTNCAIEELMNDQYFRRFNSFRSATRIPDGEMMAEAQLRMITGLEKLRIRHHDQSVAVFSHADMIKSAIAWYAGISLDIFHRIVIEPASISIIDLYDDTARILLINETGRTDI